MLPQLRRFVPSHFGQYFEPFLGSAAMFFDLASRDAVDGRDAWLTDVNRDLLGTYRAIAGQTEEVIAGLNEHERHHRESPHEHFYRVRDRLFNPQRSSLFGAGLASERDYSPALAAMFIYLNRTGFNGLYRLNSRGEFNVPAGRYINPRICDADNIRAVATVLRTRGVKVGYDGFESVLKRARKGDLLYFDPPYAPLSDTSNFTGYTAFGFSNDDQRRLQAVVIELAERGCHVILSNSTAPIIGELYETGRKARRSGLRAYKFDARRAINSKASHRGVIQEFIISNVVPAE